MCICFFTCEMFLPLVCLKSVLAANIKQLFYTKLVKEHILSTTHLSNFPNIVNWGQYRLRLCHPWRKTPDSLWKTLNFVGCWVWRNFINFVKHNLWQIWIIWDLWLIRQRFKWTYYFLCVKTEREITRLYFMVPKTAFNLAFNFCFLNQYVFLLLCFICQI